MAEGNKFDGIFLKIIDKVLVNIFGETAASVIYGYLENKSPYHATLSRKTSLGLFKRSHFHFKPDQLIFQSLFASYFKPLFVQFGK